MNFERTYLTNVKDRISLPRQFILAITGPRQIGKTTIIKQLIKQIEIPYLYVTADNVINATSLWVEQQWETSRINLSLSKKKEFLLIIDEIQKINGSTTNLMGKDLGLREKTE